MFTPKPSLPKRLCRKIGRCFLWVLLVYVLIVGGLLVFENRLVFRPSSPAERWLESTTENQMEDLFLEISKKVSIHARWYPKKRHEGAVLICHPQNANLSFHLSSAAVVKWQQELNLSVLIFDYPGYGRSKGTPSEQGCYDSAEAAYTWLQRNQCIDSERIVILGRSLGSGVAVALASERPHRALVLICPFTSLPDVVASRYPVLPAHWLMRHRFDSVAKIRSCHQPVLIFHGTHDRKVPFSLGKRLFQAANDPKQFVRVEGADHGSSVEVDFFPVVRKFVSTTAKLK